MTTSLNVNLRRVIWEGGTGTWSLLLVSSSCLLITALMSDLFHLFLTLQAVLADVERGSSSCQQRRSFASQWKVNLAASGARALTPDSLQCTWWVCYPCLKKTSVESNGIWHAADWCVESRAADGLSLMKCVPAGSWFSCPTRDDDCQREETWCKGLYRPAACDPPRHRFSDENCCIGSAVWCDNWRWQ